MGGGRRPAGAWNAGHQGLPWKSSGRKGLPGGRDGS
jgi:hypothetical protein